MKYAENYGVSRAGRKYNNHRSNNLPMRPFRWLSPFYILIMNFEKKFFKNETFSPFK